MYNPSFQSSSDVNTISINLESNPSILLSTSSICLIILYSFFISFSANPLSKTLSSCFIASYTNFAALILSFPIFRIISLISLGMLSRFLFISSHFAVSSAASAILSCMCRYSSMSVLWTGISSFEVMLSLSSLFILSAISSRSSTFLAYSFMFS
ncbi:154aa long hypothetical protein [Pyrococcus horikoshii OT3]|uniref:Uncharacterized protein n=1 Tax=Pyrococcus horikoshii (strain ATCC 700860 / DSM 12428 / JCM 9974 / NBRC 100139 / OT-3) TaxID=70601 RepID=O58372_PYRHO|nr:154aa long hypothetical protein [Pyrococcus horikoshii OT3]